jgi:hypothetical protein
MLHIVLLASVLIMTSSVTHAWWDDGHGYRPGYYNNGWDNSSFWNDGRGYGRGNASGEGSFNFSMSARGRADTDWNGDYYGSSYGGPYYGAYRYYPVPHATATTLQTAASPEEE